MGLVHIVLFAAIFAIGSAEIVRSSPCTGSSEDTCKVGEVRIDPCDGGKVCTFKKGTNASLAFDFTPNFSTNNLKTMVYWANGAVEVGFDGFGSDDACEYTPCPTEAGQEQSLNYNLHVGKKLPRGKYPLKWKVWNQENPNEVCCFKISIKLIKEKTD